MRISDIIKLPTSVAPAHPQVVTASAKTAQQLDTLEISEVAQQKIGQLQQGNEALLQAVRQSRLAVRTAALERAGYAKEYLKILARMSPSGDRGAAVEAARMAREIKAATAEFRSSFSGGEETAASVRAEIAAFAGVAGDTLKIARGLVEGYLMKRQQKQQGDNGLEKEISSAVTILQEMVTRAMVPA